jgi:methionine synthase II (cobalamin-independent)
VRARELWRIQEEWLAEAQDDATRLAIRAQEEAGLDIITDGEIRRESYSNRFATALDGVDIDNPGTALDRSGHPNPVPRVVGPIRRRHSVEVEDLRFLKRHTDRLVKMTVPGPFTKSQQAQVEHYGGSRELAAMDYATAVNAEIRDLFAAGADIVQIDEPYMQARPDDARAYGLRALNRALDGITGTTAVHICFGYAAIIHERPAGYSFLPELAGCSCAQVSIETAQSKLDCSVLANAAEDHPRRHRSVGPPVGRSSSPRASRAPSSRPRTSPSRRTRHEIPAARRRLGRCRRWSRGPASHANSSNPEGERSCVPFIRHGRSPPRRSFQFRLRRPRCTRRRRRRRPKR